MWKWLRRLGQAPAEKAEAAAGLLDALWEQALPPEEARHYQFSRLALREYAAGREMLKLDGRAQAGLVALALRRQVDLTLGAARSPHIRNLMEALPKVAGQLLRRDPDFREDQLAALAETAVRLGFRRIREMPLAGLLRAFENHAKKHGLGEPLRKALAPLIGVLEAGTSYKDVTETLEGLRALLRGELPPEPGLRQGGDAWADALLEAVGASGQEAAWQDLLAHCATATSSKPSSKWLTRARELASGLDLVPVVIPALERVGEPPNRLLDDSQTDLLRGLVWCAGLVDDPGLTAAVGKAADACFRKVQNHGPLNVKVGNACLETLNRLGTPDAVAQLSRLRTRVRHPSTRRQLDGVLDKVADRQGLTRAELEEMSVPT